MSRKLKVAVLTPKFFGEYALRLSLGLTDRCDVLVLSDEGLRGLCEQPSLREAFAAVPVKTWPADRPWQQAVYVLATLLHLIRFRPDVLHCQECPEWHYYVVAKVASWLFPVVLTVHEPVQHSEREVVEASRGQRITRLRERAHLILVNGEYARQELARAMAPAGVPIVATRHGVVLVPAPDQARNPRARRVLLFGRMEHHKGVEVLVAAAERLAALGAPLKLVLAGSGPEIGRLRDRATTLPYVVIREGFLSPSDAIEEFQQASVVVLPYLDAAQSGVAAAAFANGRPVVGSRVAALQEMVVDGVNGALVERGDSEMLAAALSRILDSEEEWTRLRDGASSTASTKLSWRHIASDTVDLYHRYVI